MVVSVGDAAGDLARHRALLGPGRQLRTRGVDDRHQGQPQLLGEAHGAARGPQRGRPEGGLRRLPAAVLTDHDAGLAVQAGERDAARCRRARPRWCRSAGRCRNRRGAAGPGRRPARAGASRGSRSRRERSGARPAGPARQARPRGRVDQDGQRPRPRAPAGLGASTTASMTPLAARFSAVCTPAGNGSPFRASKTLGPRKPTSAPGSATVTCAERPPGGVDATRGRVPQVDQVRQAGRPVRHQRPGDLDHLDEGRRALLHAGAAGGGGGQQRQALGRGPAHRGDDPGCGGPADRAREEAELVDDDRHRAAARRGRSR